MADASYFGPCTICGLSGNRYGICDVPGCLMNTTPPPTDDGSAAFAAALDAYRAVVDDAESTFYQRGCARARVLALHATAVLAPDRAAVEAAVDALVEAVGGEYPSDAETAARAALMAAHAAAVAEAEARGRAETLAEVQVAAAPFIGCDDPKPPNMTRRCCNYYGDERDTECDGCRLWRAVFAPAAKEADDDR